MEASVQWFDAPHAADPTSTSGAVRDRRAERLQMLLADALHVNRMLTRSLRTLVNALDAADASRFESAFPEHGPTIRVLLRDLESIAPLGVHRDDRWSATDENASWRRAPTGRATHRNEQSKSISAPLPRNPGLTRKERQVLELLSHGHSNEEMALRLSLSESTVRTHLRSINHKLNARSRTQAIAIAHKLGLVSC